MSLKFSISDVGPGLRPAAGLLAGVLDRDYGRLAGSFIGVDAERKLGGRAEAWPHD
jgi:hypothetical protein